MDKGGTFGLTLLSGGLIGASNAEAILRTNDFTGRYGLVLSPKDAALLAENHAQALQRSARVEFSGNIVGKLIREFCDSVWLSPQNYAETIAELTEIFYDAKNGTHDAVGDDELIALMRRAFDGVCRGSVEMLAGTVMAEFGRRMNFGERDKTIADEEELYRAEIEDILDCDGD